MDNIVYDKNIFAANLQRLMKRDREKQIDVARLLDVSKSTVSAYCSGAQMPRMDKLELLARHYGVTIAALVESGEPAPAAQGAVVQFPPCPASEIYYGLNRRGQAEYIRYGEYLSGQPEFRAERPVRFIKRYIVPAAAGYASPIEGEDYEQIECPADAPLSADFCINIQGDSMEPYIHDGELVYVKRDAPLHEFETPRVFEGCMPVEVMAKRGPMTLAYGPLKPVGIVDPRTGKRPYAVVQLRKENNEATLYNIVGFQTNLKFGEQKRVFGMIPGLENAEFVRYGVMHRNTFINSPGKLTPWFECIAKSGLYFAGQMTGVEGYIESAASGMLAGIDLALKLNGEEGVDFGSKTAIGALGRYVSCYNGSDFQPMNISFGIIEGLSNAPRNKQERYTLIAERSLGIIDSIAERTGLNGAKTATECE